MERESQNGDSGMAHIQSPLSCREDFIRFRSSKLRQSLSSQVTAISPLVDQLMMFIWNCRKTDGSELEIETAVREAISNAIIHGNHEDPTSAFVLCADAIPMERSGSRSATKGRDFKAILFRTQPLRRTDCPLTDAGST